jgi:hypothetical protein
MTVASTDSSPSPEVQRCWEKCHSEEERILKTDLRALRGEFEDSLVFGPILPPDTNTSSDQLLANNYRQLVRMLRNADSPETKSRLLAMWLRQERILQPREFLPKKIRKTLVESTLRAFDTPKRKVKRLAAKPAELLYALIAEVWKPYFELMHAQYESLATGHRVEPEQRLTRLGFNASAVEIALGLTKTLTSPILSSPTEAACRFAASHLNVADDTVLAAHSKVYPSRPQTRRRPR